MNQKLRWGILGTGNIARQFAEGVTGAVRSEMSAVGSRSIDTADSFAQQFQIPQTYGCYDQLIADPNVDAIYVALPNHLHHEWTIKALEAGKHVLCEKPFAFNAAESEEMLDVADRQGLLLVEAYMYRSHPQTHAVLRELRDGVIGELRMIRLSFSFNTTQKNNVRFHPDMAGGSLMDVGCYCIDFANMLADAPPQQAHAVGRLMESGVDDLVAGQMKYPGGLIASFVCGFSAQTNNAAYLCGSQGYITVPVPWKPLAGGHYIVDAMTPPRQDPNGQRTVSRREETVEVDRPLYALEADDFAAAVFDGKAPVISRDQILANMRVLDTMRQQLNIPTTPPHSAPAQP